MIEEEAVVVEHTADGTLLVEKTRNSACGQCATPCLTMKAQHTPNQRFSLNVPQTLAFHKGDRVVLGIPEAGVLRASLKLYLLPVLGLLLGALSGHYVATLFAGSDDGYSAAGALMGFMLVLYSVRRRPHGKQSDDAQITIVRRIP
ncbi:MAG: SoxR reducing system RseC family protein [Methylococcaceae bacterium]